MATEVSKNWYFLHATVCVGFDVFIHFVDVNWFDF